MILHCPIGQSDSPIIDSLPVWLLKRGCTEVSKCCVRGRCRSIGKLIAIISSFLASLSRIHQRSTLMSKDQLPPIITISNRISNAKQNPRPHHLLPNLHFHSSPTNFNPFKHRLAPRRLLRHRIDKSTDSKLSTCLAFILSTSSSLALGWQRLSLHSPIGIVKLRDGGRWA